MSALECSVCTELFDSDDHQPMILPTCGHGFCSQCITELYQNSYDSDITCPECRQLTSYYSVILNRPLLAVIEVPTVVKTDKPVDNEALCDSCVCDDVASIATSHCFQCEHWLCVHHTQLHARKHKSHDEVHSFDDVLANPDLNTRIAQQVRTVITRCVVHTTFTLRQYCIDCNQIVCEQCIQSDHPTHRHEDINTAISSLVASSNSLIDHVVQTKSAVLPQITYMAQQQQAIECEKNVLNQMSMKISQRVNQLYARNLLLVDEMKLMSATIEKMSLSCDKLKADLAGRDLNKIKTSVDQLQLTHASCSCLMLSHQPEHHVPYSDVMSALLEANRLLSIFDRDVSSKPVSSSVDNIL